MKCKKCNSEMLEYVEDGKLNYICPMCDEKPYTQAENPIEFDNNKYIVEILTVKSYDISMIRTIAKLCGCNFIQSKKILEETGKKLPPMDAIETREFKEMLDEKEVAYNISPNFNW